MTKFIENLKVSGTRSNMLCHNSGKIRPSTTSNFYFLFLLKLMIILRFIVAAAVEFRSR